MTSDFQLHELKPCPPVIAVIFKGVLYCPDGGCSPCEGPDFREGGDGAEGLYPGPEVHKCAACGKVLLTEVVP